jgi:hypothetical protein
MTEQPDRAPQAHSAEAPQNKARQLDRQAFDLKPADWVLKPEGSREDDRA